MYSEQLAELDRGALRRLLEDLEDESVAIRETYSRQVDDLYRTTADWAAEHAIVVAERDAGLARVKVQMGRIHRALDIKREAAAEAKAARKMVR